MNKKDFVVLGAGKLGKGYLADLFTKAVYHIILFCHSERQAKALNEQGYYTIFKSKPDGDYEQYRITDFEAYSTEAEYDRCVEVLSKVNYGGIASYADAFETFGHLMGDASNRRMEEGNTEPLDILVLANSLNPDKEVEKHMLSRAKDEAQTEFMKKHIGIISTLPLRGGYPPAQWMLDIDKECVATTDYDVIPADRDAFKGEVPSGIEFILLDRMSDRLSAKIWTANVRGALLASFSNKRGYTTVQEGNDDPEVISWVNIGRREAMFAACHHFNFDEDDLNRGMHSQTSTQVKRTTSDTLKRQLNKLKGKLERNNRLVGPAVACIEGGKIPFFLSRAIAYAYDFLNPEDPESVEITEFVKKEGIEKALIKYSGLNLENEAEKKLFHMVVSQYYGVAPYRPDEFFTASEE